MSSSQVQRYTQSARNKTGASAPPTCACLANRSHCLYHSTTLPLYTGVESGGYPFALTGGLCPLALPGRQCPGPALSWGLSGGLCFGFFGVQLWLVFWLGLSGRLFSSLCTFCRGRALAFSSLRVLSAWAVFIALHILPRPPPRGIWTQHSMLNPRILLTQGRCCAEDSQSTCISVLQPCLRRRRRRQPCCP